MIIGIRLDKKINHQAMEEIRYHSKKKKKLVNFLKSTKTQKIVLTNKVFQAINSQNQEPIELAS